MKYKRLTKLLTAFFAVFGMTAIAACSGGNIKANVYLDKGEAFVADSMPGNAKEICTCTNLNGGKVFYAVLDKENSKIDNETDYYPTLYIYNIKTNMNEDIQLRGGVYSAKKEEISMSCMKGFKAIDNNKDIILVGTNGNHMGRGLVAIKYNIEKGSFELLFESVGSKIWIEDGKIGIHQEASASAAYNFTKVYYDYNGKVTN